jgi:hypothetical protein
LKLDSNKRKAIAFVAVAFLLIALYGVLRLTVMAVSLSNTNEQIKSLSASASLSDLNGLSVRLSELSKSSSAAAGAAQDPIVAAFSAIPWLGQDIEALAQASKSAHSIIAATEEVLSTAVAIKLQDAEGAVDFDNSGSFRALGSSVGNLAKTVREARDDLASIDPASLHFGLDERVARAQELVGEMAAGLTRAEPLIDVTTTILGDRSSQRWFIATNNLAELRGTGGIIGAYAVVTMNNGKMTLERAGSDKELLSMGPIDFSSYPLELRELWGVDLGDWRDINASAHAPYAAKLVSEGWQQKTGQKVDGVLFVGQGTVAHLISAVDGVTARGKEVTGLNAVEFLSKGIYAEFTDVDDKNAVVAEIMARTFQKFQTGKLDLKALWESVVRDSTGDRFVAWSADKDTQRLFELDEVAGVVEDTYGSKVQVTLNNAGGNKLDAYAKVVAKYTAGSCGVTTWSGLPARKATVTVKVLNGSPKSGLPVYVSPRLDESFGIKRTVGSNRELLSVYGPVGSDDNGFFVDGEPSTATIGTDRGRPVWIFDLELEPGQSRTVKIQLIEPITDAKGDFLTGARTLVGPVMLAKPGVTVVDAQPCKTR